MPSKDKDYLEWFKRNTREGLNGINPDDPNIDYDYRSYYNDMMRGLIPYVDPLSEDHYPDKYKFPNHPTFSVESIYYTNPKDQPNVISYTGEFKNGGKIMKKKVTIQKVPSKKKVTITQVPTMQNGGSVKDYVAIGDIYGDIVPISQSFGKVRGKSHAKGGEPIIANGQLIEAEGDEPVSTNISGDVVFWGKMINPLTGNMFKTDAKKLAREENKIGRQRNQGEDLISESNPDSRMGFLNFNTGIVKRDASIQKEADLTTIKEGYGDVQQMILDYSSRNNIDPSDFQKAMDGKTVPTNKKKMAEGGKVGTSKYREMTRAAAIANGIDPALFERQISSESSFNPQADSGKARGIAQFTKDTAEQYGLDYDKLRTDDPTEVQKQLDASARHMKDLIDANGGDIQKALIAYNGGQGAIDKIGTFKGYNNVVGKPISEATGQELMDFLNWRRQNIPTDSPSAYQNETYGYVNRIMGPSDSSPTPNSSPAEVEPVTERSPDPLSFLGDMQPLTTVQSYQIPTGPDVVPSGVEPVSNERMNQNIDRANRIENMPNRLPSAADRIGLNPLNFLPEISAILDTPDYVQRQEFTPELYQPYRVSFQDRLNQNQSTFNSLLAQSSNNPAAMATLAGQLYQTNQGVLADEFRANQQIANEVANQNIQAINAAELQNIQLADQQYVRQAQAQANTDTNRRNALQSISDKYAQNQAQQADIRLIENLFNYRIDDNYTFQNQNEAPVFDYNRPISSNQTTEERKAEMEKLRLQQLRERSRDRNILTDFFGRRRR